MHFYTIYNISGIHGVIQIYTNKVAIIKMKQEKTYWPPCHHLFLCSESSYSRTQVNMNKKAISWTHTLLRISPRTFMRSKWIYIYHIESSCNTRRERGLTTVFMVTWGRTDIWGRYSIIHPWATCDVRRRQVSIFWWLESHVLGIVRESNVASRRLLYTIYGANLTAIWKRASNMFVALTIIGIR